MAFTYCTNCGEKIDMSEGKCPHCGQRIGEEHSYGREEYSDRKWNEERANEAPRGEYYPPENDGEYGQRGSDPRGQYNGGQRGPDPRGQYNGGPNVPPPMRQPLYRAPMPQKKRPISVGLVIFSIINIVFSCCAFTSLLFGIIALVYTIGAQNARSDEEEVSKKKIALIINIVGIVIGVISMISFSVVFAEMLAEMIESGGIQ